MKKGHLCLVTKGAVVQLSNLEARFLKYVPRDGHVYMENVDSIAEADGVIFLCPKCFVENKGSRGTHSVLCWSPKVPPDVDPKPGRWNLVGTGLHDLSLVAGSSSVLLTAGCKWHGFVRNGDAT